jgi:hypothetical protein
MATQKQPAPAQSNLDFYSHRCDGDDCPIDALDDVLSALIPEEIKIVESASAEASARQGGA